MQIKTIPLSQFKLAPTHEARVHGTLLVMTHKREAFYTVSPERMKELLSAESKLGMCQNLRDNQFEKLWALTQAIEVARQGADEDFDLFLNHLSNILKTNKELQP